MKAFLVFAAFVVATNALWVQMERDLRFEHTAPQWELSHAAEGTEMTSVTFAMKHTADQLKELERVALAVSNPQNKEYGKYWSHEQLTALLGADPSHINRVTSWLNSFGLTSEHIELTSHKDMIKVKLSVRTLAAMVNTEFFVFNNRKTGERVIRANSPYYLPADIAEVVDYVENIIRLPAWNGPRPVSAPAISGNWPDYCGTGCKGEITPQVIQTQYSITPQSPIASDNSMAVAEFQAQHWDQADLDNFSNKCGLHAISVIDKNKNNKESGCSAGLCIEALLDLEYLSGVAGPIPMADYYYSTYSLLDWINGVLADPTPSLVHSVSYGNDEIQQTSTSYMLSVDAQFQAAAAKGLTIMFASGDQGVWGRSGHTGQFNPDFPAGSPWVTAVGGSDLNSPNAGTLEVCCRDSGGGFSNTFTRPSWQTSAVSNYLTVAASTLPPQNLWNATGRAYPDISAIFGLYIPYCISSAGRFEGVAGTSASSPVVAAVIANLNNVQLSAGKAPLGFLNQWLYQTLAAHPDAFQDPVTGVNNGGAGEGFSAAKGWDPCTGVGTPNFAKLINYLP